MTFIDFFAGIGGMRSGLEKAGHTCVGFCEWDKYARQSYKAIYDTEGEWENHDVRGVTVGDIPRADLWSFGFPCQDISVAGKQKGLQGGERSGLFYEIMRLLAGLREEDKPEWIIAENVKNLLSIGNGFDFLRCITEMGAVGYTVEWQLFNTKYSYVANGEYVQGIPQNRERIYIVGHLRSRGSRKILPIARADEENNTELKPIGNIYGREDYGTGFAGGVYDQEGLSPCLQTCQGGNRQPHIIDDTLGFDGVREYDKSPTLRSERSGLKVAIPNNGVAIYDGFNHKLREDESVGTLCANGNTTPHNAGTFLVVENEPKIIDAYNKKELPQGEVGTLTANGNTSSTHCGTMLVVENEVRKN